MSDKGKIWTNSFGVFRTYINIFYEYTEIPKTYANNVSPGLVAEMPVFFQCFVPFLSAALQSGLVKCQG